MGHLVFMLLHAVALLFAAWLLLVTIPAHLIYSAVASRRDDASSQRPTPDTHVLCPDCREPVRKDARVCKHCGCRLIPQP